MKSIDQRQKTIKKVTKSILKYQYDFFDLKNISLTWRTNVLESKCYSTESLFQEKFSNKNNVLSYEIISDINTFYNFYPWLLYCIT